MNAAQSQEFTALLLAELSGRHTRATTQRLLDFPDEGVMVAGTQAFLRDILDHIAEFEFENGAGSTFAASCHRAVLRLTSRQDTSATMLTGLVALVSLNVSLLDRRFQSPDADEQARTDEQCASYFRTTLIGRSIELVYAPEGAVERRFWAELDFSSLRYHKAGTTSFILTGVRKEPDNEAGHRTRIVVKCVLFPWNKVAAIARSTDEYAMVYGDGEMSRLVVQPIASSGMWVLMPFQEGRTLGEYLTEARAEGRLTTMADRIGEAERLAARLTAALHDLARSRPVDDADPRRQHLDLSPNNVIVDEHGGQIRFIDLGFNHLYSRQVGVSEHDDAVYIAPEIKNHRTTSPTADVYSLGIILTEVLAGAPPRDGRTPEEIWTASPILAQALEDLIEERSENRLLQLPSSAGPSFAELGRHLQVRFDLVKQEPVSGKRRAEYLWALAAPTSREFGTQFKQWWVWRRRDEGGGTHDRYLLFFSALSTLAWWFIAAKTALLKIDDLVTGELTLPSSHMELYANVIAFSQGLVAAKFYQTMLARLTVRGIPGFRARCTEVMMRSMAVVAVPTTILSTFSEATYWVWPWTCAAAALAVALCNYLVYSTARDLLKKGESVLSTTPEAGKRFARGYEQWWWTMLLYALVIMVIGAGVQMSALHDIGAYVFILVAVTLGVHYGSKCAAAGPAIRGSIARGFSAGHRVELVNRREVQRAKTRTVVGVAT
ncbi:protein kinase [Nonomuraea sp. MCN248]|uniref:Protein kinase n=1 Tax=Nonomuraea corallina TaxID=2989783 RepID=A0ABT4SAT8_9ACTN|nr:protein kinase [Nonomuraea corallina]MDA0634294.1 protein kinase [Nonomuraea corallina]